MSKIWEGANSKNVDIDVKVGPYFKLTIFRAALFLIKFYVSCCRAGGAKFFATFLTACTIKKKQKTRIFWSKKADLLQSWGVRPLP